MTSSEKITNFTKLDPNSFKERIESNFPTTLMTMISIIQGAALSLLVLKFSSILNESLSGPPNKIFSSVFESSELYISLYMVGQLCTVFYMYSWFISVTYRTPDFHQYFIPFFLGFLEILEVQYIGDQKTWYLLSSLFFGMSIFAFYNSLIGFDEGNFADDYKKVYRKTIREMHRNMILCFIASIFSAIGAFRGFTQNSEHPHIEFIAITMLTFILVVKTHIYLKSLYKTFNLVKSRPDHNQGSNFS